MRDYVFYPMLKSDLFVRIGDTAKKRLGKKKGKKVSVWIGMVVLWFMMGIWHGGSWKYIIGSGLLHCFYIVGGQIMEPVFMKIARLLRVNMECYSFHLFQKLRTFFLVSVGFVFFRADSFRSALAMLKVSLHPNVQIFMDGSLFELGLDVPDFIIGLLALGVLLIISLLQQKLHAEGTGIREKLAEQNLVFRWIVFYTLIFSLIVFGFYGPEYDASSFIYEKF